MKILHIASGDLWAGAEVQLFSQMSATRAYPHVQQQVILLNHGLLEQRLSERRIDVTVYDETQMSGPALLKSIRAYIRRSHPDIVHTHRRKENILGSTAARFQAGTISVRTVHGAAEFSPRPYHLAKQLTRLLDFMAARFWQQAIVAVSSELAGKLRKQFGEKVHFIPNGLDVSESPAQPTAANDKRVKPLKVVSAGRLVKVKRMDLVVETAALANTKTPGEFIFSIFGEGPETETSRSMIEDRGLQSSVSLMGFSSDLRSALSSMDILLITSDHEGLPMILLEAINLKIPVVARAVGEIPAVLDYGRGGQLVEDANPESLLHAMTEIAHAPEAAAQACEIAYQKFLQHYTADICAARYLSLYQQLQEHSSHQHSTTTRHPE